jgi:hypothetical protein
MANEVIVGFDGSREAPDALILGRALSAAIGGQVVVARVLSEPRTADESLGTAPEPVDAADEEQVWVEDVVT